MTAPQAQQPSEWVEKAMALAQEFASTWSVVGGPFDCGDAMQLTIDAKADLRAALTQQAAAARALADALENYMSAFGQGLDAYGIPYGPQQVQADEQAIAALEPYRSHSNITGEQA